MTSRPFPFAVARSRSALGLLAGLSAAALVSVSCGAPRQAEVQVPHPHHDSQAKAQPEQAAPVVNRPLVNLPAGSFGPHLVSTQSGYVAVWAEPSPKGAQFQSVHVTREQLAHGGLESTPSPQLGLATIAGLRSFSVSTGSADQIVLLAIRSVGGVDALDVQRLGAQGEFADRPRLVTESEAQILWAQSFQRTADESLIIWAERHQKEADIHVANLDGTSVGAMRTVLQGALAWQAVSFGGQVFLAAVQRTPGRPAENSLLLYRLLPSGETAAAPIVLASELRGGYDLDLAAAGGRLVVAWSAHGRFEAQLHAAVLSERGELLRSGPLGLPRGEQHLLRVVPQQIAGANQALPFVLWEEGQQVIEGERLALLGQAQLDLQLQPSLGLRLSGSDPLLPSAVSAADVVAGLFEAPACSGENSCKSSALYAVGLQGASAVRERNEEAPGLQLRSALLQDGIHLESGKLTPTMAWDVACDADPARVAAAQLGACVGLVAGRGDPTSVYLYSFGSLSRESHAEALNATPGLTAAQSPYLSLQTVSEVMEMSRLVGARYGETSGAVTLGWLSYFDPTQPYVTPTSPAPDGRRAPVRAHLESVGISGTERFESVPPATQTVSIRARSLGGLGMAHDPDSGRRLLVWAAIDGKEPQLFATLMDASGKKLQQKMITRAQGEVTDAAVTRVEGGYVVAWVGSVGGSEQVLALFVDDRLNVRPVLQVSQGANAPTGVTLVRVQGRVYIAWSDARGAAQTGSGDLFLRAIDQHAAQTVSEEMRALHAENHLHSPQLGVIEGPDGPALVLGYIESAATQGADSASVQQLVSGGWGRMKLAFWDPAELTAQPWSEVNENAVASFSLSCSGARCRVLSSGRPETHTRLVASEFAAGQTPRTAVLTHLRSASPESTTPLLLGDFAYYVDHSLEHKWLLRVMEVNWSALR